MARTGSVNGRFLPIGTVAFGILAGNVLSYGFSFVLSHQLGPVGYGQIGTLLSLFLVAAIPAIAVQAVAARRIAAAAAADGGAPGERVRAAAGPLIRWSLLIGAAETVALLLLSPALSAALPAVSAAEVAWTACSVGTYTLIAGYLGLAQGASRFRTFTALFILTNGVKLVAGAAVGAVLHDPTTVMGAVALSWLATCAVCHRALSGLVTVRTLIRGDGFLPELGRACWGMGAALVLSLLDGLLCARYLSGATLGGYQAGALFTRAGYFGPQFIGILIYPRLAVPETRRAALRAGAAASVAIGAVSTGLVALSAGPLVSIAFGDRYTAGSSFSLASAAWIFALSGAVQALVQLAQLDAVARGSAAVGRLVLGGIGVELAAIIAFAHRDPVLLISTAAAVGTATAVGGLVLAARARQSPAPTPSADYAPAAT
jgi:hypothetical protein